MARKRSTVNAPASPSSSEYRLVLTPTCVATAAWLSLRALRAVLSNTDNWAADWMRRRVIYRSRRYTHYIDNTDFFKISTKSIFFKMGKQLPRHSQSADRARDEFHPNCLLNDLQAMQPGQGAGESQALPCPAHATHEPRSKSRISNHERPAAVPVHLGRRVAQRYVVEDHFASLPRQRLINARPVPQRLRSDI
jgi:hypothetical protein